MPLNIDLQQIFLHLLNFTILLGALYFLLYSPVKSFMDKRAAYFADLDAQAQRKLQDAEETRSAYEEKLAGAQAEIRRQGEEARQAAAAAAAEHIRQAQEEAAHIVEKARAEAQAERERIAGEARRDVSQIVMAAVEKLVLADTSAAYDQFLTAAGEGDADV
ncbi:MAG: ATP synthase F0 subunit B [Oscillospiraceae bacterium]|nr:ATP synthase F0 subunit B [Oscillospiraceae bacterium]